MVVYGYGENKCKKEIYAKDDIDKKFKVFNGEIKVSSGANADGRYSGSVTFNLPEDSSMKNHVVISTQFGYSVATKTPTHNESIECSFSGSTVVGAGSTLKVTYSSTYSSNAGKTLAIRVVLMKVE